MTSAHTIELTPPAVALGPVRHWPPQEYSTTFSAYEQACDEAIAELEALYPKFLMGNDRMVFDGGHVVYKVGRLETQLAEIAAFESIGNSPPGVSVAACRMVYHENGAPILIMETVMPARMGDDVPEWALLVD